MRSYGMSVTTLEEVFIKIAHGTTTNATADAGRKVAQQKRKNSLGQQPSESGIELVPPANTQDDGRARQSSVGGNGGNSGNSPSRQQRDQDVEAAVEMTPLGHNVAMDSGLNDRDFKMIPAHDTTTMFFKHIHACILKRYLNFRRDIKAFVFLYLIPIGLVLIGSLIVALVTSTNDLKDLIISGHLYNPTISSNYLPTAYSDASTFCAPNGTCTNVQESPSVYMNSLSVGSQLPLIPLSDVDSIHNMSQYLYDNMNARAASTIGAITYAGISPDVHGYSLFMQYIVHANFTALHASPIYQNWLLNGLVASYSPTVTVTTTLHPLPLTNYQSDLQSAVNVNLIATFLMLSIPYITASFATFAVREREV
jgi:ATP-binding cassette subfamily A (ABC1) protein 3